MDEKPATIMGAALLDILAPILGKDAEKLRRVVLDIPFNGPVKVYVERFGDARLTEVAWPAGLKDSLVEQERPQDDPTVLLSHPKLGTWPMAE